MLSALCAALLFVQSVLAQSVALTPVSRSEDWWMPRHEADVVQMNNAARANKGNIDLLMIGDSITHGWEQHGWIWHQYYGHRKAINLGFSGDRTEHVLWRLDHLPLDKISPKAAVVMIGTNNVGHGSSSPKEAADGIKAIVEKLEKQYPEMKILVLNVFPRGNVPDDDLRKKVDEINNLLPELLEDKKNVTLLDINAVFLDKNKILSKDIMPDFLHPNQHGYKLWAKAMEPVLYPLLGEINPATTPADKLNEEWWKNRHADNVQQMNRGDIDLLMIGDSITHGWESSRTLYDQFFGKYKPINLGFGGDQTQHVLWRLDHLPLDKINPKAAMIMIGTNNISTPRNTPWMVAEGVRAIIEKLQTQYPDINIILLKVFPRSATKDDNQRKQIEDINFCFPSMVQGLKNVDLIDINSNFLTDDGVLSKEIMPDLLHPNPKGYEIWGKAVSGDLERIFRE